MIIIHLPIRKSGIAALLLSVHFFIVGCSTLSPEQQRTAFETRVKSELQQSDVQILRPYAVVSGKGGFVPEDGKFSWWGFPGSFYFGNKLIANVQMGQTLATVGKVSVIGSIDPQEIRRVSRAQSVEGYDAILFDMDENIRYYIIPFTVANLTSFGEIKDYVTYANESGKYQNAQCVDLLLTRLANVASPRPTDAGLQLIDKDPSQFIKEAKRVEGILEQKWNQVEIDGRTISLIFDYGEATPLAKSTMGKILQMSGVDNPLSGKKRVPMFGYYKGRKDYNLADKIGVQVTLKEINPGKFGFAVDGVNYTVTIVHARDGSWRYRLQIPEPVQ